MYHYGAGTNVGNVRDNNEDSYVCDDRKDLWIVADGMGGLGFGEVASAISTFTVTRLVRDGHGINQAIEAAHQNIKQYAETDGLGTNMGTTIVLLLSHGSLYNIFWVGDSRAYLLDGDRMKQVTVDHSLVQSLIDQGELTREEAATDPRKNAVTRALGVQEIDTVRADSVSERWKPGQKVLLCSDGLTDCVSDSDIEKLMLAGGDDQEIVDRLIAAALEGGGKDNVTVIVVSAPTTAKSSDADTHVPGRIGSDDTHIPDGFTPEANAPKANASGKDEQPHSHQLELVIPGPAAGEAPDKNVSKVSTDTNSVSELPTLSNSNKMPGPWHKIGSAAIAAAFFLMIAASLQFDQPSAQIPPNFIGEDLSPISPIERQFPDVSFRTKGRMLQLGLFMNLNGAESYQGELTGLGLHPHIQKRIAGDGVRYAIVIGPLDKAEHQQTVAMLDANNLKYFHTKPRGT